MKMYINSIRVVVAMLFNMVAISVYAQLPVPVPLPEAQPVLAQVVPVVASTQVPAPQPAVPAVGAPVVPVPQPAAPLAVPLPQAASVPAPVPALASAKDNKAVDPNKKELDEVADSLEKIKQLQEEIKTGFAAFDEKLAQARNIDIAIKEASFDLLKQDTEQKARELFSKMETQLKELREIQKFGQGDFMKKNSDKIAEIAALITKVNALLPKLQAQAAATPSTTETPVAAQPPVQSGPQQPQTATSAAQPQAVPITTEKQKDTAKATSKAAETVAVEEQSLAYRAWQLVTDTIVAGIMSFNRAVDWVTSWIKPQKKKIVKNKNKEVLSGPDMKAKAKSCIEEVEKIITPLESQYFELVQKFQDISKQAQACQAAAIKNSAVKEYLRQQVLASKISVPVWKRTIVQSFSKLIDLSIAIADAAIYCMAFVYTYTLKPLITMFRSDLQQKIEIIEQGK